ncbi:hypothetical protein BGX28_002606 [Mortierella sp. GBA30]|nr:hypothetical protein BGX28_002606 [Mortierella sp. GBA30]
MSKRLSIFCSCLPRKQRDNLSSRSLYPDQDSSGPEDYYSDDDDDDDDTDYGNNSRPHYTRARLESLGRSREISGQYHPWPSTFSNGRSFSRYNNSSRSDSERKNGQRKPNPFSAPYQDDYDDTDQEGQELEQQEVEGEDRNLSARRKETRHTIFKPYRDDDSGSDGDDDAVHDHTTLKSELKEVESGHSQDLKIYPKRLEYAPYNVVGSSFGLSADEHASPRKVVRKPRNPHGNMTWHDDDKDEDKGGADAQEDIDVDALIAEQERITRELATQEEALRKEEEALILKKRLAAIRAAEKRGLLRFEGDQLVFTNKDDSDASTIPSIITTEKEQYVQENYEWNGSGRSLLGRPPLERSISAASSFVGGTDAFNQELKMMTLDIKNVKDTMPIQPTPTASTASPSTSAGVKKTVSTGVSTSVSTSTGNQSLNINPRDVLNNITSFLRKVDGVIAGESSGSSSDEATFSDPKQDTNKRRVTAQTTNGPQGVIPSGDARQRSHSGEFSRLTAESAQTSRTFAHNTESLEPGRLQPYPSDPFNTSEGDPSDDALRPADAFNHLSDNTNGQAMPTSPPSIEGSRSRRSSITSKQTVDDIESEAMSHPSVPAASERIFNTFTSFFNTGSSFIGLFGTGYHDEDHPSLKDDESNGRRLSSLKYGDPKTHQFNYREHRLEDDGDVDESKRVTTAAARTPRDDGDDDDDSSIDDYDF